MQRFRQYVSNLTPTTIIWFLVIVGLAVGVCSFVLALSVVSSPAIEWAVSFLQNLSAGMFGSAVTFWLIDVIFGGRKEREANEKSRADRKRTIIEQMRSRVSDAAVEAVRLAKTEGWVEDGSLQEADLEYANLQGSDLREANLYRAYLSKANLRQADLRGANLQEAFLHQVNLRQANLRGANLQWTNLSYANLQGANLLYANLIGSRLDGSDLQGADLSETRFDENTTLPDGTAWSPRPSMDRFTDPDHPDFWRSGSKFSPAYRGKKEDAS